jgi:hypothetical protein
MWHRILKISNPWANRELLAYASERPSKMVDVDATSLLSISTVGWMLLCVADRWHDLFFAVESWTVEKTLKRTTRSIVNNLKLDTYFGNAKLVYSPSFNRS